MFRKGFYFALIFCTFLMGACSSSTDRNGSNVQKPNAAASPVPTASTAKDGDYPATGTVTKINAELGSIELDHDDIPGLMPPMRMEFYVSDKKMLDGLKVGDLVTFTLRYKNHSETIVQIAKAK